jgi:hypothetical protein
LETLMHGSEVEARSGDIPVDYTCQQFLHRLIEGDELYTKVKKTFPPRMLKGGPSYCWSGLLALSGNCGVDTRIGSFSNGPYGRWSR